MCSPCGASWCPHIWLRTGQAATKHRRSRFYDAIRKKSSMLVSLLGRTEWKAPRPSGHAREEIRKLTRTRVRSYADGPTLNYSPLLQSRRGPENYLKSHIVQEREDK